MGDVKLALCMGFFLGAAVIPALFIGFVAGALAGIVLLARGQSSTTAIPFGPFLAFGARRRAALRRPAPAPVPARRPALLATPRGRASADRPACGAGQRRRRPSSVAHVNVNAQPTDAAWQRVNVRE